MTLDERVDLEDALLDIERALNDIVREVEAAQAALTALTGFARLLAEGAADADGDLTT